MSNDECRMVKAAGFTLVEMLIVVVIIAILLTALFSVAGTVMDGAKARQTRAVMLNLEQAIEQFKADDPMKAIRYPASPGNPYKDRYGPYPCDELDGFVRGVNLGIPDESAGEEGAVMGPGNSSTLNLPPGLQLKDVPHADIKALALVIQLYSPSAAAILEQITTKHRRPPDNPGEFFDRNANGDLGTDDLPLIYFVDAWGTPLQYFAVNPRKGSPVEKANSETDPDGERLASCAFLMGKNRGQPLLVSYGPDGRDQRSPDFVENAGRDLVADFALLEPPPHIIDHPLNEDNIYLDETLADRLRQP